MIARQTYNRLGILLICIQVSATAWGEFKHPEKDLGYKSIGISIPRDKSPEYKQTEGSWKTNSIAVEYLAPGDEPPIITYEVMKGTINNLKEILNASRNLSEGNGPKIRASLIKQMDGYLGELKKAQDSNDPQKVKRLLMSDRFVPTSHIVDGEPVASTLVYFKGDDHQIVFRTYSPDTAAFTYYATPEQVVEIRAVCQRLEYLLAKNWKVGLDALYEALKENNRGWANYLEHGYSQYPWETAINNWVWGKTFGWNKAPSHQLVVFHPEMALLFDLRSQRQADVDPALVFNLLGYINYAGDERDWFWGVSAATSISDSDNGLGVGATLHFGHCKIQKKIPHVSVSLLWHDYAEGNEGLGVAVNVDLYRLLNSDSGAGSYIGSLLKHTR